MRKTKLSLTLLITLAFMLVFSTVVAAATAEAPVVGANVSDGQVILEWNDVESTDEVADAVTGYNVYQDSVLLGTVTDDDSVSYSYTVTGLTNGTEYTFDVAAVTLEGEQPKGTITATPPGSIDAFNEVMDNTDTQVDDGVDFNANRTGTGVDQQDNAGEVIKSDGMTSVDGTETQRTHGEYHNNTNSCASCHQTHTGASKSLLFKDGVYNTCSACHDGTLGFYNVFESHSDLGSAGTFGGTETGNMSVHLANGATTLSAAPGGNIDGEGSWTSEFNCASCHSPHGSYSDRLLHYNPNSMGIKNKDNGGIGAYDSPVVTVSPTDEQATTSDTIIAGADVKKALDNAGFGTEAKPYPDRAVARASSAEHGITNQDILDAASTVASEDTVVVVYAKSVNKYSGAVSYSVEMSPWLYGYDYGNPYKAYWTRFYTDETVPTFYNYGKPTRVYSDKDTDGAGGIDSDQVIDKYDGVHVEFDKGYAWGAALNGANSAEVGRAYVVKLDLMPKWDPAVNDTVVENGIYDAGEEQKFGDLVITTVNQRALYAGETSTLSTNIEDRWGVTPGADVKGWGVAMTDYCASCHTDYMAASGKETGTWQQAYRHSTDSDTYTCVRCHFAHGTDVEVMRDASNNDLEDAATNLFEGDTVKATDYLLDKNSSSALKRYTNMSVCWACHTSSKAEQLKNTDSYDETDPHGLADTEGKSNWPAE